MKFLKSLVVLGLTSALFFNSIGLEENINEEPKGVILEVKPEAGKISNYNGSFEIEGFTMSGFRSGNIQMWMDIAINEEVIEDENCNLEIKQRLSKKGNVAYHWKGFESEKIDEVIEESFKDNLHNSMYDIKSFLPDKPVLWLDKWDKDIGIDFFRMSSSLFGYPIKDIENKPLELILFNLDRNKNTATIYFNIKEKIKDYNDKNVLIKDGSLFFMGHTDIEYEKKELIDFEAYFNYLFDGKINGEDIFIRLDSNFNLKNEKYKE